MRLVTGLLGLAFMGLGRLVIGDALECAAAWRRREDRGLNTFGAVGLGLGGTAFFAEGVWMLAAAATGGGL